MTRDETVTLLLECEALRGQALAVALAGGKSEDEARGIAHEAAKAHWNAWANDLLAERKAMEADGRWEVERNLSGILEAKNGDTLAWMEKAKADFSYCQFETPASLRAPRNSSERELETLDRGSKASRDDGPKDGKARGKSIKLEGDGACFSGFIFPGDANFQNATFFGNAEFESAIFQGGALFDCTIFQGIALYHSADFKDKSSFDRATVLGVAHFETSRFLEAASFEGAIFKGKTRFTYARFRDKTAFNNAAFRSDAWFDSVGFKMSARYDGVRFHDIATFAGTAFSANAWFNRAVFAADAFFDGVNFKGEAWFVGTIFSRNVFFYGSAFRGSVSFDNTAFKGDASFNSVVFSSDAAFSSAVFSGSTSFANATFRKSASFCAISAKKGFDMADAELKAVPVFVQAHFEEAPRFDNLSISRQWWWRAHRDLPSRWRALKRLAILGHDSDRELEFHARELCSQRFAGDWPLPLGWRSGAWGGFSRFWFGIFYGLLSDFGRSLARPFIASGVVLIAAAAFYLSQTEVMQRHLAPQNLSYFEMAAQTARYALDNEVPCYRSWRDRWPWWRRTVKIDPNASRIDGLTSEFRGQTNARAEAWHLALRNAFIVLDSSSEAAHRTYGCLYGVELYGGSNPLAIVPSAVSTASAIQKLFSALMIFLFGLALRNMLKMK